MIKGIKQKTKQIKPKSIPIKRDMQPSFPSGLRISHANSIMIIDFLTSQEMNSQQRSFSSIVVNKDVAKDLIRNLITYMKKNNYEFDNENVDDVNEIKEDQQNGN